VNLHAELKVSKKRNNRYSEIIERVFRNHFRKGRSHFDFERDELETVTRELGITLPKNLGDLLYSFRFRSALPSSIAKTAGKGREWIIELAGCGTYRFRLTKINRLIPDENAYRIKIPDATPEIIKMYAKTDEQALLAKVRYNRLIDIFLRVTAHSMQSHLRTTVPDVGQIEVDELYVGVRNTGQQFVIPVQAKGKNDQLAATQLWQDLQLCRHAYPKLTPRLVAVQFLVDDTIAMFELAFQDDELRKIDEKHYTLVLANEITADDLDAMENFSD
jgi:hypothetical protein